MEVQQAEDSETAELARVDKLEAELAQAERELSQLGAGSSELDSLEERYWHDFNDFQLQLRADIDERDVLVNRVHAFQLYHALQCLLSGAPYTYVIALGLSIHLIDIVEDKPRHEQCSPASGLRLQTEQYKLVCCTCKFIHGWSPQGKLKGSLSTPQMSLYKSPKHHDFLVPCLSSKSMKQLDGVADGAQRSPPETIAADQCVS